MATWIGDLVHQAQGGASIVPQASAAQASYALVGNTVDLLNSEGPITFVLSTGSVTGTPDSQSVTWKIQYSADNFTTPVDYTAVGAESANPLTAVTAASTDTLYLLWHPPVGARYWRVVATVAFVNGTTPKIGVAAYIFRQKKSLSPGNAAGSQGPVAIS